MMSFFKKNIVYIFLFLFIVLINILIHFGKDEQKSYKEEVKTSLRLEHRKEFFTDFEEAKRKSEKLESILRKNAPLHLFYVSFNLFILFIFLGGILIDGAFLAGFLKGKSPFKRSSYIKADFWSFGDVVRILILGFSASYFVLFSVSFVIRTFEEILKFKFGFIRDRHFNMIVDTLILDGAILLSILYFLWHKYKKGLVSIGLSVKNFARNLFYGICSYIGIIPVIFFIGILVYIVLNIFRLKVPPQPIVELFLVEENTTLIFVSSLLAAIVGPVIEEIFFRGVIYNAIKRKCGILGGILLTSIFFSILHTHDPSYFIVGFLPIFVLGVVLAYLYEKTGSLIPSISLHILNNIGGTFMVFILKYMNSLLDASV